MNNKLHSYNHESYKYRDEEDGLYIAVPITDEVPRRRKDRQFSSILPSSWACYIITSIQMSCLVAMVYVYGFAPYKVNPFIGPPIDMIDYWGSKNPRRIVKHGEYWRLISSIFFNVGIMDLFFSTAILFCLSYHLEKRWGSCEFLYVYLVSGIGGNIIGTLASPNAISVGSGGCIFGLLGAMHIEMIYYIILQQINNSNEEEEDEEDESEDEDEDESDEDEDEQSENQYILRNSFIVLGFLAGLFIATLIGILSPNTLRLQKDWSVLYGGMISGMMVKLIWKFCSSLMTRDGGVRGGVDLIGFRIMFVLILLAVPVFFDCYMTIEASKHRIYSNLKEVEQLGLS